MRAVLPTFKLLVLFVELRQKLGALIGDLVAGLRWLLHTSGLDHDLWLHAHLRVLVLHHHYPWGLLFRQDQGHFWESRGWWYVGAVVGRTAVGGQGVDEVVDAVGKAGYFGEETGELELLWFDGSEFG